MTTRKKGETERRNNGNQNQTFTNKISKMMYLNVELASQLKITIRHSTKNIYRERKR